MTAPESFAIADRQVLCYQEDQPGSGRFHVAEALRCHEILQAAGRVGRATFSFALGYEIGLLPEDAVQMTADLRLAVRLEASAGTPARWLFDGYPNRTIASWIGDPQNRRESAAVLADHAAIRLANDPGCQVWGQTFDPLEEGGPAQFIGALPAIFNPDGEDNCSLGIYFTYVGNPDAIPWTFARALLVLLQDYGCAPLIDDTNVYDLVLDLAAVDPPTEATATRTLADILVQRCDGLTLEGCNFVEAMNLLCSAAGLRWAVVTEGEGNAPTNTLRLWAPGEADAKAMYMESPARAGTRSAAAVFAANNFSQARVIFDYAAIVNRPTALGEPKRYEITAELLPGWPNAWALNPAPPGEDPGEQEDMLEWFAALIDEGEYDPDDNASKVYHRSGPDFPKYSQAGRKYILNEAGDYPADTYKRTDGPDPWTAWERFDIDSSVITTLTQALYPRRRRFLPPITTNAQGEAVEAFVQVSLDDGVTWLEPAAKAKLVAEECAIYFECDNPAQICRDAETGENALEAVIKGTFRVRITATIEADQRLVKVVQPADVGSPLRLEHAAVLDRPKSYLFRDSMNTNSVLAAISGMVPEDRDDQIGLDLLALRYGAANADRAVSATFVIPWLSDEYDLGECISRIEGRLLDLSSVAGTARRYPEIVARLWRFSTSGAGSTHLALEDLRTVPDQAEA